MFELIKGTLNNTTIYRCPDCKCWEYEGKKLRRMADSGKQVQPRDCLRQP